MDNKIIKKQEDYNHQIKTNNNLIIEILKLKLNSKTNNFKKVKTFNNNLNKTIIIREIELLIIL